MDNYISARHNGCNDNGQAGMFRFLKYLLILLVIGAAGLFGYSYLLEPDIAPITTNIEIDAG
ncbi:MAG: hypothetical protein AAF366_21105 [Pseudomonadota bacterium]